MSARYWDLLAFMKTIANTSNDPHLVAAAERFLTEATNDEAWIHYDGEPAFVAEACPTCGSLPAPTCGVCTNLAFPHGECPEHGA